MFNYTSECIAKLKGSTYYDKDDGEYYYFKSVSGGVNIFTSKDRINWKLKEFVQNK